MGRGSSNRGIFLIDFFFGVENVGVVLEGVCRPLRVLDEVTVAHLPKIRVSQLDWGNY